MKKRLTLYAITAVMLGLLVIVVPSNITPQFSLQEQQQDDRQSSLPEDYSKNGGAINSDEILVASNNALRIIVIGLISGILGVLLFQYFSKHV